MSGLMEATALAPDADCFRVTLDPAWDIWGPAGGYIAAIALRAVGARAEIGHRPLTLSGQFVRVAKPGALSVAVEAVKTGRTALYAVTLTQNAETIFLAQVWTSARAEASLPVAPVMPDVARPAGLRGQDELAAEHGITVSPFWRNIDGRPTVFRLVTDPPAASTHQQRWMRFREWAHTEDVFLNAMRYALLIDIGVWPAHWHRLTEMANYLAPSLDVWVHFHGGEPAQDWILSDADTDVSGNGLISGRVRLWSEAGRAVATGGGQCLVAPLKT